MSDTLSDGRKFRIFRVVDDYTRECLAMKAGTLLSGARAAGELETGLSHAVARQRAW